MNIVVYSRVAHCPFCIKAKQLLQAAHLPYEERQAGGNITREQLIEEVAALTGTVPQTVPQIFIDGQHIGGCTELEGWMEQRQSAELAGAFGDFEL